VVSVGISPDRDPTLPHQVVLTSDNHHFIYVSCNCRVDAQMPVMGTTADFWETRELFNDPDNHVRTLTGEAFSDKYTLKFEGSDVHGQRGKGVRQGSAKGRTD
jgi:hypothetical protein